MKQQSLFIICMVLVLAANLTGIQPVAAQTISASTSPATSLPLEVLLESDGTLDVERGFQGRLDTTGWQMVTGQNGEPHFVPANATGQTAISTQRLTAVPGDENWDDQFAIPGPNGPVYAIAISGGEVYAGGSFTTAGGVAANYIAKWDGTSWSALGSGLNGGVSALAVSGSEVYAGGSFTTAGGVPVNNIAKWDGTSWSALGSGVGGGYYSAPSVLALAVSGDEVYAGGSFTTAGGVAANYIAKWDGTSWSALGSGTSSPVYALAASGNEVYAGGYFTTAGGVPANYIAKWDGTSWSALGSGLNGGVSALAVSGSEVYAGGTFNSAGGVPANYIAKWDGASWSALGSGMDSLVYALAVSGSEVYAGGFFWTAGGVLVKNIAKWDGTSWSALGSGINSYYNYNAPVLALAVSGNEVYAGSVFLRAGGAAANYIAKWDGTSWSGLNNANQNGLNGSVLALAVSGSDVYVGGWFNTVGDVAADHIAKWDGTSWSALGNGINSDYYGAAVEAVAVSGGEVYAGGQFSMAGGVPAKFIAKWDGTSWSALGSGMNNRVYALAASGSEVYAGGYFTSAGGVAAKGIAKWDGTSWSTLGSGVSGGYFSDPSVLALAVSGDEVYAGGSFSTAGGVPANNIAKWDGTSWSALGSGVNGYVSALAVSGSEVYVGVYEPGDGTYRIAKWDGTSWSALGSGFNNRVLGLAVSGSEVYAGGDFTSVGGLPVNYIAKWDGTSWSALGSGVSGGYYGAPSISALAVSGSDVYAGGYFTSAGGKPSSYFGRYVSNTAPTVVAGGPYDVDEGGSVTVTATGNDSEGGPLTYTWDLDNDGIFETPGQSVSFSAATLDGPGSTTIAVQVTDQGGLTATSQGTVNVLNVAPTAAFTGTSGRIVVGGSVTFSFRDSFDPGAADRTAGLRYSYDCTDDGAFELAEAAVDSYTCPYPAAGTFNALGRIADKDGGFTDYTVQVTVLTPRDGTEGLIDQVQALIPDTLSNGQGNALIAKLEGVIKQLEKGKPGAAINELQAFINQVNSFMNATPPILTPEEGQSLIDAANAIIAALGS